MPGELERTAGPGPPPGLSHGLTLGALAGLVLGGALGLFANGTSARWAAPLSAFLEPLVSLWLNALRMAVLPLILTYLVVAITSTGDSRRIGRLGGLALGSFVSLLVLAAGYALLLGGFLAELFPIDPATVDSFRQSLAAGSVNLPQAPGAEPPAFLDSLRALVPANLFQAVAEEQILPAVVGTALFAAALTKVEAESRLAVTRLFRAAADAVMILLIWILRFLPLGVFALSFNASASAGLVFAGAIGYWAAAVCATILGFILLQYPIARVVGRVPIARFARAVAPAQVLAAGARSSLVCLPVLLAGARRDLELRESVAGFVLPLSSSVFKLSGTLGSPLQLFFLARLLGIELDPVTVTTFILGIMLVSFGTPGIPSGGLMIRAPFFIAAGIPLEGFILTMAADTVTDIFKTIVNVTADMTVACAVNRFDSDSTVSSPDESGAPTSISETAGGAVLQGAAEE